MASSVIGGALGWVLPARTRCEYIHVSSSSTSCLVRFWQAIPTPASAETEYIHLKPMLHDYPQSKGCAVPYFRTVSDRMSRPSPQGGVHDVS